LDLDEAMDKKGLKFYGARGIGGERPRECRYAIGYDWRTNDQDKKVPDGHCMVESPFPLGLERNERREATCSLKKKDWTEVKKILSEDPTRLRCFVCGLFEGETNHIGQKTCFQKGHGTSHLGGGTVAASNITAICRYCNGEMKNIYDIDLRTGKKKYLIVPFLKNRANYKEKLAALEFLAKHLKKKDIERIIKEFT